MRKRFGKYTSRLKLAGKKAPIEVHHAEIDKMQENETVENRPDIKTNSGGEIKTGGGVSSGGGLKITMPKIPFEFANHGHAERMIGNMSDYAYKHVQSAAAYIAGKHNNKEHHPILAHRHLQTQHMSKYHKIMQLGRAQLTEAMRYDPHLRDALANSVHAAHVGGVLDMRKPHMDSIGGSLNFNNVTKMIKQAADPIESLADAKKDFDAVGPLDKLFSSPRHFAKAALHGYAGNFRAHAAYGKAVSIGLPVVAPSMLPAAMGMEEVANHMDEFNNQI